MIRKAERRRAKLRLALVGPTGSGKSFSSLQLGFGLGGKVGLIDTENGSGDLYADVGDYDIIPLDAPYTVSKYRDAIREFEQAGYSVIIIDSLSHAWVGEGGLLDKQGRLAAKGGNSYTAWREVTPDHNRLVEQMLRSPAHIIATMRVKTEYVLETNDKGRQVPRKVGLAPVQRDGLEYEFTVVLDIEANHVATAGKDRTRLFDGWADRISPETGKMLLNWLNTGAEPEVAPKKRTAADFLAELHPRLMSIASEEEFEAIEKEPGVQWAFKNLSNGAAAELAAMWAEARDRLNKIEEEVGAANEP